MIMSQWKVDRSCKLAVTKWVRVTHKATGLTASGPGKHEFGTVRRLIREVQAKLDRRGVEYE